MCCFILDAVPVYVLSRPMTKPTKWHVHQAKINLGIRPVWSESSLSAWRQLWSLATHWAHSEDTDQTGRMPRLIIFDGHTVILLDLSRGGSFVPFPFAVLSRMWNSIVSIPDHCRLIFYCDSYLCTYRYIRCDPAVAYFFKYCSVNLRTWPSDDFSLACQARFSKVSPV